MGTEFADQIEQAKEKAGVPSRGEAWLRVRLAGLDVGYSTYEKWEQGKRDPNVSEDEIIEAILTDPKNFQTGEDMQDIPEIEMGAGDDVDTDTINGNLVLPRSYIRSEYGVQPERLVIMRVRGRSMVDTLQPGQKVLAARQNGQDLENDTIYGLRSSLGFSVKRLRFDWEGNERVIWILSDNPEQSDQNLYLTRSEFEQEYDVVAKALEVGQKL
jgi:phage repressor protein C with HTH and peptisase S24 domain